MATTPNYTSAPRAAVVRISTANANRDGTGTVDTLFAAGSSGSRIESVDITAIDTTTAGMVRFYLHNGTSNFLYREVPISAVTPSATAKSFATQLAFSTAAPLLLPSGWSLRASTEKAESFDIAVVGGDF